MSCVARFETFSQELARRCRKTVEKQQKKKKTSKTSRRKLRNDAQEENTVSGGMSPLGSPGKYANAAKWARMLKKKNLISENNTVLHTRTHTHTGDQPTNSATIIHGKAGEVQTLWRKLPTEQAMWESWKTCKTEFWEKIAKHFILWMWYELCTYWSVSMECIEASVANWFEQMLFRNSPAQWRSRGNVEIWAFLPIIISDVNWPTLLGTYSEWIMT